MANGDCMDVFLGNIFELNLSAMMAEARPYFEHSGTVLLNINTYDLIIRKQNARRQMFTENINNPVV